MSIYKEALNLITEDYKPGREDNQVQRSQEYSDAVILLNNLINRMVPEFEDWYILSLTRDELDIIKTNVKDNNILNKINYIENEKN